MTAWNKGEQGGQWEDQGTQKGSRACSVHGAAPCNGKRGLDKNWRCLLAHLPHSGAAGLPFRQGWGEGVSGQDLKSSDRTAEESWEILISLPKQLGTGTGCSQRQRNQKEANEESRQSKPNQT